MGSPKPVLGEGLVGLRREVSVCIEQQFHALPELILAQEERVGRRL
jgi:hypothetical protein